MSANLSTLAMQQQGMDVRSCFLHSCIPPTCQRDTCLSKMMQWVYQIRTVRGLDVEGTKLPALTTTAAHARQAWVA